MKELVAEGKTTGTVVDYGTGQTKTNKDFVYLWFQTPTGRVKYTGYLSPAALEHTMNALVVSGCTDLGAVAEGPSSNAFTPTEVALTVIHEADQADPTKKYAKVRFVNPLTKPKDASVIAAGKNALLQYAGQFELSKTKAGVKSAPKATVGF